jgi:DNA invertase Pin-like site-specific DNA recombinase
MSESHSSNGRLIPAAAYYRMSDPRQDASVERQRSQVVPYAVKHGYEIVREYTDDGIPGDEVERRRGFCRLLADAQQDEFRCILCDDKDRFGRFDAIDYGYYVKPLRDAGVWLEAVAQGKVDWHSLAGRLTDTVQQEGKQMEAQAISRRVLTQFLNLAKGGSFLGSPVPYGYRLHFETDARGQRVRGSSRLVPGDPREVETVGLVFHLYGDDGLSIEEVCEELFRRGIPSPRGRARWSKQTVAAFLANRRYVGDMPWNAGSKAKYTEQAGGQLQQHGHRPKKYHKHETADLIVKQDAHEALIDRDLFERVQRRLVANRFARAPRVDTPAVKKPRKKLDNKTERKRRHYAFAGLLVCVHCGGKMAGYTTPKGETRYHCATNSNYGSGACDANSVGEAVIREKVFAYIERDVLDPDGLAELHERRRVEYERIKKEAPVLVDRLRRQVNDLTAKIDGLSAKLGLLAEVDPEGVRHYAATIRGWREQRECVEKEIAEALRPSDLARLDVAVGQIRDYLTRLQNLMANGDPRKIRLLLAELIDHVELTFEKPRADRYAHSKFKGGIIYVRPQVGFITSGTQGRL